MDHTLRLCGDRKVVHRPEISVSAHADKAKRKQLTKGRNIAHKEDKDYSKAQELNDDFLCRRMWPCVRQSERNEQYKNARNMLVCINFAKSGG